MSYNHGLHDYVAEHALSGTNYVSTGEILPQRSLSMMGAAVGAYHGYQRIKDIKWALFYAVCGWISPIITTGVAVVQGFGESAPSNSFEHRVGSAIARKRAKAR